MSVTPGRLALELPDALLDEIATRVAARLADAADPADEPWIGVQAAAEHLGCKPARVYALVSARRIPFEKDGSRVLFKRSQLDAWIEAGGGRRP